ncbi:TetR/AcrR family transcriptional regulator [Actinosynnema sp. NPDC050436]|uniref:TetR/AcrR family transcriptional regulator n=1 Tax=Actinosynnema sp. NPDC050436 TaxID=3155659 RepID=UPI0033F2284A
MTAEPRTGRAPRGTLDRELIIRTATAIMESDGLEAVTMRRIATELKVRPMALYTYFRSKDEILAAIYDDLLAGIALPAPGTGTVDDLREILTGYYRLSTTYPELLQVTLGMGYSLISPHELRVNEALMSILTALYPDRHQAVGIGTTLVRFAVGAASLHPLRQAWDDDPDYWERVRRTTGAVYARDFPTLHSFAEDLEAFTQEEIFTFGLEVILGRLPQTA